MLAASTAPIKRETLNLRIKPEDRNLIDHAARTRGKNRTDFVLEAARSAAQEALLDRAMISVSPQAYAAFLARLDMPPQPSERLRKTMRTPAPWDKAVLNKSPRAGAARFGMGCEAQSAAIPGGIASICNDADRLNAGCASREGLVQRCHKP